MTPWTVACQASLSTEISRQEYWSGQPFPSPGDRPNPGIKPRSPTLQVDSVPSESPGKPKNTGVGSLSLLQGTFLTQELNRGLLHCFPGGSTGKESAFCAGELGSIPGLGKGKYHSSILA